MSERIHRKANEIINKKASQEYGDSVKRVEITNQKGIGTERDSKLRHEVKESNKHLKYVVGYTSDVKEKDPELYMRAMTIWDQCKFRLHRLRGKLTAVTGEDENWD